MIKTRKRKTAPKKKRQTSCKKNSRRSLPKRLRRPGWRKSSREAAKAASKTSEGKILCCICGKDLTGQPVHIEHHQPYSQTREKYGNTPEVFNTGGPMALACPHCNLTRTHKTPVKECVLRNRAFRDRIKTSTGWKTPKIRKFLNNYHHLDKINVGKEVSYEGIENAVRKSIQF